MTGTFAAVAAHSFYNQRGQSAVHLTKSSCPVHTLVISCDLTYALFQSICVYLFYQPFGRSVASRLSPLVIGINLQNPLKKGSRVASYLVTFIPNHHSRFPHMTGLGHQEVPSWSKATKLIFAWLIPKRGVCFTLGPKVKAVSGEVRFYDCAF